EINSNFDLALEDICKRPDIDAIIIASPNAFHKEAAILAAKYKKHIFCEKPNNIANIGIKLPSMNILIK
ncbi:Gfo/Idh/MocA family oxidoreductase, partial [Staphylococcus pseudintermedius]|uniref:Gfo/Idh/MocA family oxidoreductase n=1 Tax=Staphylococcus pseudintermedius TaxID=283734 RepID=UPI000D885739